ncbi:MULTISPECIES: hypothetical protein [Spirulina sp. CCY15215]|uniref:hypothetical protein n=1 Tax=Spirulina sp. CCY15215 TaxID=2767591 RepID=UPI00194DD80C|nr:hypothetical protein [Spirulina major]
MKSDRAMKISAPTSTQLIIEPKSSDLKATLAFLAIILLAIASLSAYLFGFVMPKDSILQCDRLVNSPLQCQIEESFALAKKPKIEKFTGLVRSRLDKSVVSYFADRYIQLQTNQKILGFVSIPDRQISFPTSNYFDLIFLSDEAKNAVVWQINQFIGDRTQEHLKIRLKSYTIPLIFCLFYFPILLIILTILILAILTREKYTFDKNTQTMTWFNQILPFQPTEYQFSFSTLKMEVYPANDQQRDYTITLQSYHPTAIHSLYSGRDRDRAGELALLLSNFLEIEQNSA